MNISEKKYFTTLQIGFMNVKIGNEVRKVKVNQPFNSFYMKSRLLTQIKHSLVKFC